MATDRQRADHVLHDHQDAGNVGPRRRDDATDGEQRPLQPAADPTSGRISNGDESFDSTITVQIVDGAVSVVIHPTYDIEPVDLLLTSQAAEEIGWRLLSNAFELGRREAEARRQQEAAQTE